MTKLSTAIVIGGGVAGCATAISLRKAGIDATIYEARDAGDDDSGIMLTLGSNGIDALAAIDADASVRDLGFPTAAITLRSHTGRLLGRSVVNSTDPAQHTSRTIRRADLNRALQHHAMDQGVSLHRGRRLVDVRSAADGIVALFDDGGTATADILVGADGVRSVVRRRIDPAAPAPRYAGLITTGGYAQGVDVAADAGTYEMIFGKRAFFGYANAPDGTVWWFVNVPQPREPARGQLAAISSQQWRSRFASLFSDDAGPALDLIAATPDFAPMTPIHTVRSLRAWHAGRAVILGDAAHAPSPTSGQGASLAIEDAVVLARSLRDQTSTESALAEFERIRRPRVERIVKAAARINNNKAAGPFGRRVRDAVLPPVLRLTAGSRANREVYEHHLVWSDARVSTSGRQ